MITRLIGFCLERAALVFTALAALAASGVYAWRQLAIEAYPDIGDTTSQIVTLYPGRAAEEVEQQVTIPLERELFGTPGMHVMRSQSAFGLSLITVVFKDGVEDYFARERLREQMSAAELPEGVEAELDPLTSPTGEIFRYTLESPSRDPFELKELQDWVVKPRLRQVFGVAEVTSFGGEPRQFQVIVDPHALQSLGLTARQVEAAIVDNSGSAGGSLIVRAEQGFVVRGLGAIRSLEDLGAVVIESREGGVPILVRDVAELRFGGLERTGVVGKNDDDDVVMGIVVLLKGENPSRVLSGIHAAVAELHAQHLPEDVRLVPYLDRSDLVDATLRTVARTLLEGMGLVSVVLILFLGSVRGAVLVALTMPFALLFAFLLMHFTAVPANLLSLGAIDFGILVDGAIVLLEVVLRRRERSTTELTIADARAAALEVARPMVFSALIIMAAYLPLFAFERVEQKLFTPMAFTVGYAVLGALVFALTAVPALAFLLYRRPGRTFQNPVFLWLRALYDRVLVRLTAAPGHGLIPGGAAIVATCVLGLSLGRSFLPYLDEGSLWLQISMPPGISLNKAQEIAAEYRAAVREFPEVSDVVTQLGRNEDGTDPWTTSHIESFVGLRPYREWGGDKQALIARMQARLDRVPGISVGFAQPMIDGVNDKIAGAHSELVVKVFGTDFDEMRRIAGQVREVLAAVPGAVDVMIDQEPPLPQLRIDYDREAAARHGITVSDMVHLIEGPVGGRTIAQVFEGDRVYDIALRYPLAFRNSPEVLGNLLVSGESAPAAVPLASVARLSLVAGESMITREMGQRHLSVTLNLRGRDLSSFLAEAQRAVEAQVDYDRGQYRLAWGGLFENQQRAQGRLAVVIPAALGLIFMLLYLNFGKGRHAALIMLTVPLALLGGFAALHLRGMTLNVSSAVGFIALFGVAVQNGVIMLANLNRWREQVPSAEAQSLAEAVRRGARERLRPVLMTATVATLGLLPAALARGIGSDVQRPLATVVVGGLITATFLTLIVLPAAYYVVERRWEAEPRTGGPVNSGKKAAAKKSRGGLAALLLFVAGGLGFFAASPVAQAADARGVAQSAERALSHDAFLSEVLAANLDYAAERYEVDMARAEAAAARLLPNPTLELSADRDRTFRRVWASDEDGISVPQRMPQARSIGITQTLELGGKRRWRTRAAQSAHRAAAASLEDFLLQLKREASTAFIEALAARHELTQKREESEALEQFAAAQRVRAELGDLAEVEALQAQTEALQVRGELRQAEAEAWATGAELAGFLGSESAAACILPLGDLRESLHAEELPSLESLVAAALSRRPDLVALRHALEQARGELGLARAERVPDVDLGVAYTRNAESHNIDAPSPKFNQVELSVSLPLPLWNRNQHDVRRARFAAQQAERRLSAAELKAEIAVRTAHAQYEAAREQVAAYERDLLRTAEAVLAARRYSYERGESALLEFLDAQRTHSEVREGYRAALTEAAKARLVLENAAGGLQRH
ncbi:CusA/CzcA family heavy metal efflux RND transporter [Cephaloticoccus primus]|uniref:CusA/CzcA family heavy metal efflux RND transporter n=1 Tax=Cephaloticoccus primus TaxID=1548207 RepID=UPI000838B2B1|nr:CusA/CzcA family heavy metal efflux RND transporter [Cephaloticoccus primus]